MTILNITYQGRSADYHLDLDHATGDADIRRIAVEVVRSGGVRGLHLPNLPMSTFNTFVVDRLRAPNGEQRIYLRPKVPFGCQLRV
ncbi:MAG: hypothetical protein H0V17_18990 [Deltaproteobacteria bacterium]|nr:hypothetical protein [Deltaproteobacteria bacterium]